MVRSHKAPFISTSQQNELWHSTHYSWWSLAERKLISHVKTWIKGTLGIDSPSRVEISKRKKWNRFWANSIRILMYKTDFKTFLWKPPCQAKGPEWLKKRTSTKEKPVRKTSETRGHKFRKQMNNNYVCTDNGARVCFDRPVYTVCTARD